MAGCPSPDADRVEHLLRELRAGPRGDDPRLGDIERALRELRGPRHEAIVAALGADRHVQGELQRAWMRDLQDRVVQPLASLQERWALDDDDDREVSAAAANPATAQVDEFEVFRQQVRADPSFRASLHSRSPSIDARRSRPR